MTGLDAKLAEVADQYDDLQARFSLPETTSDPDAMRYLGRELARLEPVVAAYRQLEEARRELSRSPRMRDAETDDEIRQMARDEDRPARGPRGTPARRPARPVAAARPERRP